jgi:hypothetical protein
MLYDIRSRSNRARGRGSAWAARNKKPMSSKRTAVHCDHDAQVKTGRNSFTTSRVFACQGYNILLQFFGELFRNTYYAGLVSRNTKRLGPTPKTQGIQHYTSVHALAAHACTLKLSVESSRRATIIQHEERNKFSVIKEVFHWPLVGLLSSHIRLQSS